MSEGKYIKTLDTFSDYDDYLNYLKYSKKYFVIKYIASNISLINKFFSSWVIMVKILIIVVILLNIGDIFLDKIFFKKLESVVFLLIFIYTYITSMSFYYIMFNDKYTIKILYILMAVFVFLLKTNGILQLAIAITFIAIAIYLYTIVKTKINKSVFLEDCETSKIYIDNIAKTDEKNILKNFNDLDIFKGHKIYEVLIGWLYLAILLLPVTTVGLVIYMIFFDHNLDMSIIQILVPIIITIVLFILMITNIFIFSFHGYISCIDKHIKNNYQR